MPIYELTVSPRGAIMSYGKLEENPARLVSLPAKPTGFRPKEGTYAAIAALAVRLNEIQIRSGFLDYIYAPDIYAPDIKTMAA